MTTPWSLVFAFDHNYVLPAAVSLRSIDTNIEHPPATVYIVAEGITASDAELIERQSTNAPVEFVPATSPLTEFGNIPDTAHATPAQFLKCLAPRLLEDTAADRLIYIDPDTLVLGDLGELAHTDLGGNIAGFVQDRFVTENVLDPGDHPYFNAGLFLADRKKWNDKQVTENILATITEHADILRYGDQDALNKCLSGAISPLAARWNHMLSEREKVDPAKQINEDVAVLHFCGPVKPWKTALTHPYLRELYDSYLTKVSR